MLWPYRLDNWRSNAIPAQNAFLNVAKAIAHYEPVTIGVPSMFIDQAKGMLMALDKSGTKHTIDLTNIESDDSWMRDVGPTFLIPTENQTTGRAQLLAMNWIFNAWGQKYDSWDRDDQIASRVGQLANAIDYRADFILEGGSIHVDGEGTVLTTEECLLNPNRNSNLTKEEIEARLLSHLNAEKVIWLPFGLTADEDTNGHIDNICCFTKPGEVLLSWTDDHQDEFYEKCRIAYDVLTKTPDARNRPINVVKLPIPPPMYYREEDFDGLVETENDGYTDGYMRQPGKRLAASYVNFYIANGGIVCPAFHPESDEMAAAIFQTVFPGYSIHFVPGRDILLGGGNIHCITQQQPKI